MNPLTGKIKKNKVILRNGAQKLRSLGIGMLCFAFHCLLSTGHAKGLSVFVQNFSVDDYKASCQNWKLAISPDGLLYVANNIGLLTYDGNSWRTNPLPDHSVVTSVTFSQDTIFTLSDTNLFGGWLRDEKGIPHFIPLDYIRDDLEFEHPEIPLPFEIPAIIQQSLPSVIENEGDFYFFGTSTNGLFITDQYGNILQHLSLQNQLNDNIVRDICIQDQSQIWVALDNGLARIALNPSVALLGQRSQLGRLTDAALVNDTIYIQTHTGYFKYSLQQGISFIPIPEEEASKYINVKDNPPAFTVNQIFKEKAKELGEFAAADYVTPASDNHYWLSLTNEVGLFRLEHGEPILKCRLLLDNYNMNLVSRGTRIVSLNDSLYLFSAMQGTLLVNLREIISSTYQGGSPIRFARLEYTDDSGVHNLDLNTNKITLPERFHEFIIQAGTTIFTPNNQISYKIDEVNPEWSEWQKDGKISFMQLREGTYHIHIRKYVVKGPFPEAILTIYIPPRWYNTIWAWLIYIGLGWIIATLVLRYYLNRLKKEEENRKKEEALAEKQRLEALKREMLENELQSKNNELSMQTSALVKRNQSIRNLQEELERQKKELGERYPNKFYNRMQTLIAETLNDREDWLLFESHFNSAHQNFIERLREQFTDLTTGDLRICCLLRMNLTTKEIASLLNISIRAVELRRYRLRKRLNLEGDTNLVDFLISF